MIGLADISILPPSVFCAQDVSNWLLGPMLQGLAAIA